MSHQIEPLELKALMDRAAVHVLDGSPAAIQAVKVVDGSWALDGTDMHGVFKAEHIPGAQFFDIEAISDHSTSLPHMVPTPEAFAAAVGAMGIAAGDRVVIYDRQGLFSAARVWWTFRLMGHQDVQVLRGGLPAWKTAGLPVTDDTVSPSPSVYVTKFHNQMVMDLDGVRNGIDAGAHLVLDARSQARFDGSAAEPRAGLRSGHMPGSRSLPFTDLIHEGALKPGDDLRAEFAARGVGDDTFIVTSCGSGVTAAIISLALAEIGHDRTALYDGSWAEWGQDGIGTTVLTGKNT